MTYSHRSLWAVAFVTLAGCAPDSKQEDTIAPASPSSSGGSSSEEDAGPQGNGAGGEPSLEGMLPGNSGGSQGVAPGKECENVPVRPKLVEVEVEVPVEVEVQVPVEVEVEVPVEVEVVKDVPTALYVMLDRSQSMDAPISQGAAQNLWQSAVSALAAFVNDVESNGLQVGIQYFPLNGVDYGNRNTVGPACTDPNGAPHNTPAVPMALLPDNAPGLVQSLNSQVLAGNISTPTEPALRGAVDYCATFQTQNPDWNCIAVFVTDGEPRICSLDLASIAAIAGQGKANADVTTFAIGMGEADFGFLNMIATQGEGDCDDAVAGYQACDVTAGPESFLEALRKIRSTVGTETHIETRTETRMETRIETRVEVHTETRTEPLSCEWGIPDPPEGRVFDKEKVNVQVTLSQGEAPTVGKVDSEADCAGHPHAWYYDDPNAPTRVKVCPNTCTLLQQDPAPNVDILLGCKSDPA